MRTLYYSITLLFLLVTAATRGSKTYPTYPPKRLAEEIEKYHKNPPGQSAASNDNGVDAV